MNNITNLEQLYRAVGRMEGKLDSVCGTLKDHGKRINDAEEKVDNMKGKSTAYGMMAGFLAAILVLLARVFLLKDK